MLRRVLTFASAAAVFCLLCTVTTAHAQEARPVRLGFGGSLGLGTIVLGSGGGGLASSIYIPIRIHGMVIIEPEFGVLTTTQDDDSTTGVRVGLGVLIPIKLAKATFADVGLRGGAVINSDTQEGGGVKTETSRADGFIGAVIGAEHFLSESFSLGGEIQLNVHIRGTTTTTVTAGGITNESEGTDDGIAFGTTALFTIRWFFL